MQDHIKSIRSWHYTLVLFAIAGLAMSVDLLNTDRSRKIMLSYLALEEQRTLDEDELERRIKGVTEEHA